MGLDMYAWKTKNEDILKDTENVEELAYWRKHNRLHGYMEQLWIDKGYPNANRNDDDITVTDFNCIPMELTKEDLLELRQILKKKKLPETQGFFFGHDSYEADKEWQKESDKYDLKFVTDALRAIRNGYKVVYDSWW